MTDFAAQAVRKDNGYSFYCPVVNREALFMACEWMKIKHWRGERIPCGDCAAAMNGCKCPAVEMLRLEHTEGVSFFDTQKRVHQLPRRVIDRIAKVLLFPFHNKEYTLTSEQSKIFDNEPIQGSSFSEENTTKRRERKKKGIDSSTLDDVKEMSEQVNEALKD